MHFTHAFLLVLVCSLSTHVSAQSSSQTQESFVSVNRMAGMPMAQHHPLSPDEKRLFSEFFVTREGLIVYDFEDLLSCAHEGDMDDIALVGNLTLVRNVQNERVVEVLGGVNALQSQSITLKQLIKLLKAQWGGNDGILTIRSGNSTVFHCVGKENKLFAVMVERCEDAWLVFAMPSNQVGMFLTGDRILYRKPLGSVQF